VIDPTRTAGGDTVNSGEADPSTVAELSNRSVEPYGGESFAILLVPVSGAPMGKRCIGTLNPGAPDTKSDKTKAPVPAFDTLIDNSERAKAACAPTGISKLKQTRVSFPSLVAAGYRDPPSASC
jgi:hypothetical protein